MLRIVVAGTEAWIVAGPGEECRLTWDEGIDAVAELSAAGFLQADGPLRFRLREPPRSR